MKLINSLSLLLFTIISVTSGLVFAEEPWKALFDGKTLDGWEQKGGQALYAVEDGQIIGKTVLNTPNSFLCTKQLYSDFILELEFKVDPKLNSGVQTRSNSFPDHAVKTKRRIPDAASNKINKHAKQTETAPGSRKQQNKH